MAYCDTLYRDLKKGLEGLVLESLLHLVYLTTPYDVAAQSEPDWMLYFKQVRGQAFQLRFLQTSVKCTGETFGIGPFVFQSFFLFLV